MKKVFSLVLSASIAIFALQAAPSSSPMDVVPTTKQKSKSTTKNCTKKNTSSSAQGQMAWAQGQWRYISAYGAVNIYISGSNMKVYFGTQLAYSGRYTYDNGSGFGDGWERLLYPDGFVLIDSREQRLYYDKGIPMQHVK
ncbi:hypothetical protein [Sodaliphilus sp.]|uniref:hypothetical protein n=1 Tax=Sodaliphilus sp. TaxID=2815818 RepID=UPI00388FAC3C